MSERTKAQLVRPWCDPPPLGRVHPQRTSNVNCPGSLPRGHRARDRVVRVEEVVWVVAPLHFL